MAGSEKHEHLLNHLRDAHAIEVQALRQLARAAQVSADDVGRFYEEHLEQTKQHEQTIRELIEGHDLTPSPVEDKTMRGGVIGLRQLSDISLNTPVRVAMHLFALEHLKIATYELLQEIAKATEDEQGVEAAERILEEERAAAEKIEESFDQAAKLAVEKAARKSESSDGEEQKDEDDGLLLEHLCEVHALEQQALYLLQAAAEELCEDDQLKELYSGHLEETREHEERVRELIEAHDAKPSAVRDLHLGAASVSLRTLSKHPPDAAVKVAMNFFCFEHLEIAAYELLARIAKEAGDQDTAKAAEEIAKQERQAAENVHGSFERCVELMLESDATYEGTRPLDADEGERSEEEGRTEEAQEESHKEEPQEESREEEPQQSTA